jgi:hypothetical protein
MTPPRQSPVTPAELPAPGTTPVYVYGVVRTGAAAVTAEGVGSAPARVRLVRGGDIAAVVSEVPADWRAAQRSDLQAHDRVLSELVGRETVVPMRFGSVMGSDDEVRVRLLERHGAELTSLLRQLDGRVQMSVKVFYLEEALLRRLLKRHPDLKRRSRELEGLPVETTQALRIALGRDVADALQEQRALDGRLVVDALAPLAHDLRVEPTVSERQAATVQLLVDVERRPALDAVVDRLAEEWADEFALRYVGPLPPYSFSDLSVQEAA